MHQFYDGCLTARLAGTCEWALVAPTFQQWSAPGLYDGTARLLWINGPAGFGKTILAASLIQHSMTSTPNDPVAFFFFSAAADARDDPLAAVRTWTSQLVTISDVAFKLAVEHASDKDTRIASASEVWSLFAAIAQNMPGCVLILDGFDECVHTDDRRADFLASLKRSIAHTATRLLIICRDEPDIRSELCAAPSAITDDDSSNSSAYATPPAENSAEAVPSSPAGLE